MAEFEFRFTYSYILLKIAIGVEMLYVVLIYTSSVSFIIGWCSSSSFEFGGWWCRLQRHSIPTGPSITAGSMYYNFISRPYHICLTKPVSSLLSFLKGGKVGWWDRHVLYLPFQLLNSWPVFAKFGMNIQNETLYFLIFCNSNRRKSTTSWDMVLYNVAEVCLCFRGTLPCYTVTAQKKVFFISHCHDNLRSQIIALWTEVVFLAVTLDLYMGLLGSDLGQNIEVDVTLIRPWLPPSRFVPTCCLSVSLPFDAV